MKRLLWLVPLLLGCTTIHQPPVVGVEEIQKRKAMSEIAFLDDTLPVVKFRAPFIYHMWLAQVKACTGVEKEGMPALYLAPVAPLGSDFATARYYPRKKIIVFSLGAEVEPWIVRHEFLHWLLDPQDTKGHPDEWFSPDPSIGRCAALITPRS